MPGPRSESGRKPITRRLKMLGDDGAGPRTGVWLFPDRDASELVALMALAEELGLDEVWIGDEGPAREPFSLLAAASQVTGRIRLGIGVTNPYLRHPPLTAATMLTINELSNGRAVLGVGAGGTLSLAPFELSADQPVTEIRRFIETVDAVGAGRPIDGFHPSDLSIRSGQYPLPVFVGARGPRINRLASELADGAFVSGMPPFRYREVIGWARSVRPISIALYPSVAFGLEAREHHRAEMVYGLSNTPPEVRARLGVADGDVQSAVAALAGGDKEPARALMTDALQEQLMLIGEPAEVGQRLAALAREHRPESIGLAVVQPDLEAGIRDAAKALAEMRRRNTSR